MSAIELEKLPGVQFDRIEALATSLLSLLSGFVGAPLAGPHLSLLCRKVAVILKCQRREETVQSAIHHYWGTTLNDDSYRRLAHFLAGNAHKIRKGITPRPWDLTSPAEWMLATIVGVRVGRKTLTRDSDPEAVLRLGFRVTVGTLAPADFLAYWRKRHLHFFSQFLGFRRKDPTDILIYDDFLQLVGLRVAVRLEPHKYDARRAPTVTKFKATPSFKIYNENIIKMRSRDPLVTQQVCPFSYTHRCHRCSKGQDECLMSMRSQTLHQAPCSHCHQEDALFDGTPVYGSTSFCVACHHKELLT